MLVRKDDHWNRDLDIPDIRNWRVVDTNDRSVGFVQTVVVDREANVLEAILTGANERFSADRFEVDDGVIRLAESLERQSSQDDDQADRFTTFEDAFRDHFKNAQTIQDREYDDWKEAYGFGRLMALDADFSGREYYRAKEDLRAHWIANGHRRPYDLVEDAVAFAYDLTHRMGKYRLSGLEREREQILGRSGHRKEEARRTAEHTTMGSPPPTDGSTS